MKSSLPYVRAQAERMAINAPIQGTQADSIKLAMVRVDEMLGKENAHTDAYLLSYRCTTNSYTKFVLNVLRRLVQK